MSVHPLWLHEVTLAAEPASVGAARRFVRQHLSGHDLPLLVDDITLVASELTTNAVIHAGTSFTVTITAFVDAVVLTVSDGSPSPPRRLDALAEDGAGRGVAIVEVVSRDWGVIIDATAGKSVWAAFDVV